MYKITKKILFTIMMFIAINVTVFADTEEYCIYTTDSEGDHKLCYELDETNCNNFGYFWDGTKCDLNKAAELSDEEFCKKIGGYYNKDTSIHREGCYELNEENCNNFGFFWDGEACYELNEENCNNFGFFWDGKACYELNEENCNNFGFFWDGKACDASTSKLPKVTFDVSFNLMDGYVDEFECPLYTSPIAPGVCYGDVERDTVIKYPAKQKDLIHSNYGALVGWANSADSCVLGKVDEDLDKTEFVVNDTVNLYACYKLEVNGLKYAKKNASMDGQDIPCGSAINITWCKRNLDDTKWCYYDKVGEENKEGWVSFDKVSSTPLSNKACKEETTEPTPEPKPTPEIDEGEKKCPSKPSLKQKDISGEHEFQMCYKKTLNNEQVIDDINDGFVVCRDGYTFDPDYTYASGEDATCNDYICKRDYKVKCNNNIPVLYVTSGIADSSGKGTISVKAKVKGAEIDSYYVSEEYKIPTELSDWIKIDKNEFTITDYPGVKYFWVKDSNGNISSGVGGAVIDTSTTSTTVGELELYDSNNNVRVPASPVVYKAKGIVSSKYVKLSNSLNKENIIAENGFNPFDTEYQVEVNSPTITVYATLTSSDAEYVSGYEPRTVNLDYGINTVLIKVRNKEGKVRTYTILVTRVDDRKSDNTLKDLSVDIADINFDANVTDYKIEVPKDTNKVNVSANIASSTASYVSGYEPGDVTINGDTTVKIIKVKSETGSTRSYVLTFVKEGTDEIEKDSLKLFSLDILDVRVPFEEDVSNYSLSVDYSKEVIDINATLKDSNSNYIIRVKKKSDSDYKLVSGKGVLLDVGENFVEIRVTDKDGDTSYYRLTIVRKEFGLDVSNDTSLTELKVLGYDIDFKPDVKEYTVKIKQEKSLVITAIPSSSRSEVFIKGNNELTGFSTVRVKVVAEDGEHEIYSIDIKKDAFNKNIEIIAILAGCVIILVSSCIIIIKNKSKKRKDYYKE